MDNRDLEEFLKPDHSLHPAPQRRDVDSPDDFEHLTHDAFAAAATAARPPPPSSHESSTRDIADLINTGAAKAVVATNTIVDDLSTPYDPLTNKMDTNLMQMDGDAFIAPKEDKLEKFIEELPPPKHQEPPEFEDKDSDYKSATKRFVEGERGEYEEKQEAERYTDSEPDEDFKPSKDDTRMSPDLGKTETFKDVEDFEPELPKKDYPVEEKVAEPEPEPELKEQPEVCTLKSKVVTEAEAIFCQMGLDTWFNPEKLNPKVESLIYWRDPKKSGPVFGGVLVILLALTYFSLISVIAYLSLLGLTITIAFRIYKNIVQAVQKTGDGHPFKEYLDLDVALPLDKVKEVVEVAVAHLNAGIVELRRLFLVEDLVDSIKFGILLWTLTYLGAWFNGMTLIIIAWVALFSLPKVYEANKTQIDNNLEIVRTKLAEITSKVKAAIPIGKKGEEKKVQ